MKKILFILTLMLTLTTLVACSDETYIVKFDTDGGLPEVSDLTVKAGSLIEEPSDVVKEGYTLEYWFNVENHEKWEFKTDKVESNLVLKASYKEDEGDNDPGDIEYETVSKTVSLKYSGGSTSNFSESEEANNANLVSLESDVFTVLGTSLDRDYGEGPTKLPVGLNKDGSVRLYSNQEDGTGNKLTVKLNDLENKITKVVINFVSTNDKNPESAKLVLGDSEFNLGNSDLLSSYSKDNLEVTEFSLQNNHIGASSNQIWISEILITYSYEEVVSGGDNNGGNTGGDNNGGNTGGNNNGGTDPDNPTLNDEAIMKYYQGLIDLEGSALSSEVTNMIKTKGKNQGKTPQVKRVDIYQGQNYNIYDGFGAYGNREHVWPSSKLGSVKDDLHNLRAAVESTNSKRSNYPFGEGVGTWKLTNQKFYPGDDHIGDVARIVLYQQIRYNLPIERVGNLNMFLKWHLEDPVSDFERSRNTLIQNEVGSRNPFIDFPEYVTLLFGSHKEATSFTMVEDLIELLDDNIVLDFIEDINYYFVKEELNLL